MIGGLGCCQPAGVAPVAIRTLVTRLGPLSLLVLRLPMAGLVLLPWAVPMLRHPSRCHLARLALASALGLVSYHLSVTVAPKWLPASTTGPLLATRALLGADPRVGFRC